MPKESIKKRKKDLGIFYTTQEVVSFIFEILNIWKNKEDEKEHRWQTRKPSPHYPSVIDPACGEGVFLKNAVTSGFTGYHPTEKTPYVFGVDLDGEVVKKWEEISILHDLFKGEKKKMLNHFHQQDGLLELPKKVFNYKTGGLKEFDAVVGNPPYGGIGFSSLKEKSTSESIQILEYLRKFDILSYRKRKKENNRNQTSLWGNSIWGTATWGGGNLLPTIKEVESIPIEILFIDRFIQLAKPGGWIAIIIPDGILTNSNSHYVREFISHKTKVKVIVSLPRGTFKNVGTNTKTSILFLKKLKKNERPENSYPVLLASTEKIENKNFNKIAKSYKKFYNSGENHMNKSNLIQTTKDQEKREAVMIRVDKTLKDLMEERPQSRFDVNYWHPDIDKIMKTFVSRFGTKNVTKLGDYITGVFQGDTFRAKKGDKYLKEGGNIIINVTDLLNTGISWPKCRRISESHYRRVKRAEPQIGDLLFIRLGGGSIGRTLVFTGIPNENKIGITGHINRVTIKGISSFYIDIFLKTYYGQRQIKRFESGTSNQTEFRQEDFSSIFIPNVSGDIQKAIEFEYKKMSGFHNKAMEARKKGDKKSYRKNLEAAERTLKALIKGTEELIEGKRKDVN